MTDIPSKVHHHLRALPQVTLLTDKQGAPSSSSTVTSYFTDRQTSAEPLTSFNTSSLCGSSSTIRTDVGAEATTNDDDRLMKEKLIKMFPSNDIKLPEEAVYDSMVLEEAVDIFLYHADSKSGKLKDCTLTAKHDYSVTFYISQVIIYRLFSEIF